MRTNLLIIGVAGLVGLGCSSDKKGNDPISLGDSLAVYTVTFASTWSEMTHPMDFPPNPHFSGLIGATHNDQVVFWRPGLLASPGIQNMAELGSKDPMNGEIDAAIAAGTARFKLSGAGINPSPGQVSLEFTISRSHPLVSLVSMIAPSPDWFVGVADLPLLEQGEWLDSLTVELYGWDAGTDDGVSYTSENAGSSPHVPIFSLNDGMFKVDDMVPALGTYTLIRRQ